MATQNYLEQLKSLFKNVTLNAVGVERDLYQLIADKDISRAIGMFQERKSEVDNAIREYNVQTHKIMNRPNKPRKGSDTYITEKLPRNRAHYINEVELFFLLGNPINFKKESGDDEAYKIFTDFLIEHYYDGQMRKAKRLAGAETESAKLYRLYRDAEGEMKCDIVVLARSLGYDIRPMFDQYGKMSAFACGYKLNNTGKVVQHWDIYTSNMIFLCVQGKLGWEVTEYENIISKIPAIYYQQPKAWDGAVARIEREEMLDSKQGDTNNYFSDPIATATADVVESICDPDKPGKLIQLTDGQSRFEYVNPPQASGTRESEQENLHDSILFDTLTPDFSFEKMRGMGSLSGVAIHNAMVLGFLKRKNRMEIYEPLVRREIHIIKEILKKMYPGKAKAITDLKVTFEFSEPFETDEREKETAIVQLYKNGLMSREQALMELDYCEYVSEEIERIKKDEREQMELRVEEAKLMAGVKAGEE